MRGLPAPSRTDWIRLTTEPEILSVLGCGGYTSHWDATAGKSFRCIGAGCATCNGGVPADPRYVFLVARLGDGTRYWLELRRRHYKLLEIAEGLNHTLIGTRWSVRKEWNAANARVEITFLDWKQTDEVNVERFVESLACRFPVSESRKPLGRHLSRLGK